MDNIINISIAAVPDSGFPNPAVAGFGRIGIAKSSRSWICAQQESFIVILSIVLSCCCICIYYVIYVIVYSICATANQLVHYCYLCHVLLCWH